VQFVSLGTFPSRKEAHTAVSTSHWVLGITADHGGCRRVLPGVTTVHDMGRTPFSDGAEASWDDLLEVYVPAAERGELPIRIYAFVPLESWHVVR
jgi:hypothetical protein